jgi:hypothetical protein
LLEEAAGRVMRIPELYQFVSQTSQNHHILVVRSDRSIERLLCLAISGCEGRDTGDFKSNMDEAAKAAEKGKEAMKTAVETLKKMPRPVPGKAGQRADDDTF